MFVTRRKRKINFVETRQIKRAKYGKKCGHAKATVEDDDGDDAGGNNDIEEEIPIINPLELLKKEKMIYRTCNHIYFRSEITFESINKLGKLIDNINREFELIVASCTTVKIIPKPTYLHITSEGGDVMAGLLGCDLIKNSKIPIYTVIEGHVASAATFLSIVGKKRLMTENSYVLMHQLSSCTMGNFEQLGDSHQNNSQFMDHMKSLYIEAQARDNI